MYRYIGRNEGGTPDQKRVQEGTRHSGMPSRVADALEWPEIRGDWNRLSLAKWLNRVPDADILPPITILGKGERWQLRERAWGRELSGEISE